MYDNELYHYGVKGMKWGVRKERVYKKPRSKAKTKKLHKELTDLANKASGNIWKGAAKRIALKTAIGTVGAAAIAKYTKNKELGMLVASAAGASVVAEIKSAAAWSIGVQAVTRMGLGVDTVVQNQRCKHAGE